MDLPRHAVVIPGHPLSITPDGHLDADATADAIAVEGTAKGRLQANTCVTLRATAMVVGEILTPTLRA